MSERASERHTEKANTTHTHTLMLASRARSRVKNGTCQERRRQERGAITRHSERDRRSGETIERLEIHEGNLMEKGGRLETQTESGVEETADRMMKRVTRRIREGEKE